MFSTPSTAAVLFTAFTAWVLLKGATIIYNIFFHPLRGFPGPLPAKASDWYKTYVELYVGESWCDRLARLHQQYGEVVRVGPSELHFSEPEAYFDIYNNLNRWDKEEFLYHAFGEDRTSFGYLTYAESKQRKDVLQPLFSRRAIINMQSLISSKINQLADLFAANTEAGKTSDIYYSFRCFTVDTITTFCFANSINALSVPDFKAPIALAMDATNAAFQTFKHLSWLRWCIFNMPPWLSLKLSPETSGLTNLQIILRKQVNEVYEHRDRLETTSHPTIYHRLLDPEVNKSTGIPEKISLYEEAQTMIFAGTDTVGNTLYVCFYHLARNPSLQAQIRDELKTIWPRITSGQQPAPTFEHLEKLPLLTALIKESLRLSSGVVTPLPRIVPPSGATIAHTFIPGGTNVGISSVFVHHNPQIFPDPFSFKLDRWIDPEQSKISEKHFIPFSRGPRSCLGINLAWCEMYYAVATLIRRFDVELDETQTKKLDLDGEGNLKWKDAFLPWFAGEKVKCWFRPVDE